MGTAEWLRRRKSSTTLERTTTVPLRACRLALRQSKEPRLRLSELRRSWRDRSTSLRLLLTMPTRPTMRPRSPLSVTRDNYVRLNAATRRPLECARRWLRRPILLTAEPRPLLERWRRPELFLTLLSVARDRLRLN